MLGIWYGIYYTINSKKDNENVQQQIEKPQLEQPNLPSAQQTVLPSQQFVEPVQQTQQVVEPIMQPIPDNNVAQPVQENNNEQGPRFIHTVDNDNYNTVQNYNANVDDGALNPNQIEITVDDNVNIPNSTSFINTESSLMPNIEIKSDQPQIIIPGGQGVGTKLMEGFGNDVNVIQE